jgi:hypothetical protein
MVNGGEPGDSLFKGLARLNWRHLEAAFDKQKPEKRPTDLNMFRDNPELSRTTMRAALATRRTLAGKYRSREMVISNLPPWLEHWRQAKAELFPSLEVNHYHMAFDPDFGLVTGKDDHISLLVHGKEARNALRKDLQDKPERLDAPPGFSNELAPVTKHASLMGSLPAGKWDAELVDGLMALQKPVYFLPHCQQGTIAIEPIGVLQGIIGLFNQCHRRQPGGFLVDPLAAPAVGDFSRYESLVRRLSAELPGDREFIHRTLIRQASGIIYRLALMIEPGNLDSRVLQAIAADLYRSFLRGISYGIASLKYHAYGLGLGIHRSAAVACLSEIRQRGETSRRDLQRKVYTLNADSRDHLLQRLEEAGLILTEGKMVRPVSLAEFLKGIPIRERFPEHSLLTACLSKVH